MPVRPSYVVLDIESIPDARWTRPEDPKAFPPTCWHQIVCVGFLTLDEMFYPLASGTLVGEEREILRRLAAALEQLPTLITYNGRTFDLPVIIQRSIANRIAQRWYFEDRDYRYRYSTLKHIDVCDEISDHGAARAVPLDAMSRLVGQPGKAGVDGRDVERLVAAGELERVRAYCLDDVRQTALLFFNLWHVRGNLRTEELDERCGAVVKHFAPKEQAA